MHPAAERSQHTKTEIAQLVAAALDHNVAIGGDASGGRRLLLQIVQQILGGARVQAVILHQSAERGGTRKFEQLPRHSTDRATEFSRASGGIAVPEWHLARLSGRGRNRDAVVSDIVDAPRRCAQQDCLSHPALKNHLLIQFAHSRALRRSSQKHAEQAAVRNCASIDDGNAARPRPRGQAVADPVPGQSRMQFREVV